MTSNSTWGDLTPLNAQQAVIHLGGKYCVYLDTGDFDALAKLFAADATVTVGARSFHGTHDIDEFFRKSKRGIHLSGLPFVTATSATEARSVQNFMFAPDGESTVTRGTYIDHVRRDGAGCVFVERIVEMHPSAPTE